MEFDLTTFLKGMYFFRLTGQGKQYTLSLIIDN